MFPTKQTSNCYIMTSYSNKVDSCAVDSELYDLYILLKKEQLFVTMEPDCQPCIKTDDDTERITRIVGETQKNNNKDVHIYKTSSRSFWTLLIFYKEVRSLADHSY